MSYEIVQNSFSRVYSIIAVTPDKRRAPVGSYTSRVQALEAARVLAGGQPVYVRS
jgi:hypothetical protein